MINSELLKLIEQMNEVHVKFTLPPLTLSKKIATVINNPMNDIVNRVTAPVTAITKSMKVWENVLPASFYTNFLQPDEGLTGTPDEGLTDEITTGIKKVINEIDMRVLAMIFFFSDMPINQQKEYCKRYQKTYKEVSRRQKPFYHSNFINSLNNHTLQPFLKTIDGAIEYMRIHKIKGIRKATAFRAKVINIHCLP